MPLIEMGECPVHGLSFNVRITDNRRSEITTGPKCQTCYIEWLHEHLTAVVNVRLVEVA